MKEQVTFYVRELKDGQIIVLVPFMNEQHLFNANKKFQGNCICYWYQEPTNTFLISPNALFFKAVKGSRRARGSDQVYDCVEALKAQVFPNHEVQVVLRLPKNHDLDFPSLY